MITESDRVTNRKPVLFRLIDKDGRQCAVFKYAHTACEYAMRIWPDQDFDEERTGKGWYIEPIR